MYLPFMTATSKLSLAKKNMTLWKEMWNTLNLQLKYIKLDVHVASDKMVLPSSQKFKIAHSTRCLDAEFGSHGDRLLFSWASCLVEVSQKRGRTGCHKNSPAWTRGSICDFMDQSNVQIKFWWLCGFPIFYVTEKGISVYITNYYYNYLNYF